MKFVLKSVISILVACSLIACGGGSCDDVQSFPDAKVSNDVRLVRIGVSDKEFHPYSELHFTLKAKDYFNQNTVDSHAAMVMRTDLDLSSTAVNGVGMVFGDVSGAGNPNPSDSATEPNKLKPSAQIETWFNGHDSGNFLLTPKNTPPILFDGVSYDVIIKSIVEPDKAHKTIQVIMTTDGKVLWDSGVLNDPNKYLNYNNNGVAFGHVFRNLNAKPWEINITNVSLMY
jgi:hypothetical protein